MELRGVQLRMSQIFPKHMVKETDAGDREARAGPPTLGDLLGMPGGDSRPRLPPSTLWEGCGSGRAAFSERYQEHWMRRDFQHVAQAGPTGPFPWGFIRLEQGNWLSFWSWKYEPVGLEPPGATFSARSRSLEEYVR